MTTALLQKGFEVELFTGRPTGENVGVSSAVAKDLPGFVTEPDHRNLEYITDPLRDYGALHDALLAPRRELRQWLSPKGLTLLPGSTLSLGDNSRFERSNPDNPYHGLIEQTYGTRVVTASIHINLGLDDPGLIFAAVRLVRCEAALYLALSASSPFLAGECCQHHSQRWHQFPLTPSSVPLFHDHDHYIAWVLEQLSSGAMWNERHLWTSVRPNGPRRPYELNRLELRICDLVTDPVELLAITALLELRIQQLIREPERLDPLAASPLSAEQLMNLADTNDAAAAGNSLQATLRHWQTGDPVQCSDWIRNLVRELRPLADELAMTPHLSVIEAMLTAGNQAMQWLEQVQAGASISDLIRDGALAMERQEQTQRPSLG